MRDKIDGNFTYEVIDPILSATQYRNYAHLKGGEGKEIHYRQKRYTVTELLQHVRSLYPRVRSEAFEGELVDFSISGARCRLAGSTDVKKEEILQKVAVIIGNENFYDGSAKVVHVRHCQDQGTHGGSEIGLQFLDNIMDISRVFRVRSNAEMGDDIKNINQTLANECVTPEYRRTVADFQYLLTRYRTTLTKQEQELALFNLQGRQETELEILEAAWASLENPANELQQKLDALTFPNYSDRAYQNAHRDFTMPLLTPCLAPSPFFHRAWAKPLGYPGDYGVMNYLYDRAWEGNTLYGKLVHRYGVEHMMAKAVRARKVLLRSAIDECVTRHRQSNSTHPCRIISLGSGPAREVIEFLQEYDEPGQLEFLLIDQDNNALEQVYASLAPIIQRNKGKIKVNYLYISFADLLGDQTLFQAIEPGDFVYCAGMFDYLSKPKAEAVLADLYSKVRDNGLLIVGNFGGPPQYAWIISYCLDWNLRYRDLNEMEDLASTLAQKATDIRVVTEETGIHFFIRARRPAA
jgi:hypothetical protein